MGRVRSTALAASKMCNRGTLYIEFLQTHEQVACVGLGDFFERGRVVKARVPRLLDGKLCLRSDGSEFGGAPGLDVSELGIGFVDVAGQPIVKEPVSFKPCARANRRT